MDTVIVDIVNNTVLDNITADYQGDTNTSFFIAGHVLASAGLLAGGLSLLALLNGKRPFQSFHILLMNLAVADVTLDAFIVLGTGIHIYAGNTFDELCAAYTIIELSYVAHLLPLFATVLIVMNQCLAVNAPLRYQTVMTKGKVSVMVSTCWVFVFLVALSLHIAAKPEHHFDVSDTCQCIHVCDNYFENYLAIRAPLFAVFFILFSVFTCTMLFLTYYGARKQLLISLRLTSANEPITHGNHHVQTEAAHPVSSLSTRAAQQKKRLSITIGLLVGCLMIFWTPGILDSLFLAWRHRVPIAKESVLVHRITNLLFLLNPICNFVVYGVRILDVQNGYRRIISRLLRRRRQKISTKKQQSLKKSSTEL